MSCDTNRRRLWKALKVNADQMEVIFYTAKIAALKRKPTEAERALWVDKTERLLAFFDYQEIPRPVHSKSGLPRLSSLAGYAAVLDALEQIQALNIEAPAGITGEDLKRFLTRLGELANQSDIKIELAVMGGAAMVLGFSARVATMDVDAVILSPKNKSIVRALSKTVAEEHDLPEDWLNDAAAGFLKQINLGERVYSAPGIEVWLLCPEQLLATKLGSWRSKKDRLDASRLLQEIGDEGGMEATWQRVAPFLTPHQELKSRYAFVELWQRIYGS